MNQRFVRTLVAASVGVLGMAASLSAQERGVPKTVVLGFDGASADRVETMMADAKLPNLKALAERGGYSKLRTSNPAQSPVSWATITTGWNPGKTGIYDFLRRVRPADGQGVKIDIGLAEPVDREVLSGVARAALITGAGFVGAAAGTGLVLAIYAGARRKKRPHGLLQGTMTGVGAVFASVAYVALAWVPGHVPYAHNLRDGEPFWVTLDKLGVRCIALEAPLSFPADEMDCGSCLSGLGVPDVAGTWGTFAMWTDDPQAPAETETGGVSYFVAPGAEEFEIVLTGPKNPLADPDAVRSALKAADVEKYKRGVSYEWPALRRRVSETEERLLRNASRAVTTVKAQVQRGAGVQLTTAEGVRVGLAVGVWSDLIPVVFRMSPVAKLHGRVRFLLQSPSVVPSSSGAWSPMRLFISPVQFDPAALPPNAEIASPMEFAGELARVNGPFETLGWPEMTNPVKDDVLADRDFLSHLDILRRGRETRLMERLARSDWDCLFAMFSEPDRVQHALYRHVDKESPRHDPAAAVEFGGEIDRAYLEMDRLVGEVMKAAPKDTRILVVSDHGFAPFRRGVNLNNLLCSIGLQFRGGNAGPLSVGALEGGKFFTDVRWEETKAYAMGLGNLYLNLEGREAQGCVKAADAEAVLAEIEAALMALRDTNGAKVVRRVYRGKDLFHGARAKEAPDLVVGFEWGYRVSWQTCLGSVDDDIITDNTQRWSGDHCSVDPELVPGILFSSMPLDPAAQPNVVDVNPSILSIYGASGPEPDGKSFLAK